MRAVCLLAVASATAISLIAAPCVPASLSTYTAAGFTCEVDSAVFSDFDFLLQNGGAGDVLGEDDITVSPLVEPGAFGLRFAGDFQATGGPNGDGPAEGIRSNEYRFFFSVTRPGSVLTSVGARLNDPLRLVYNPLKFGNIFTANHAANDGAQAFADDDDPDLTEFDTLNSERVFVNADNLLQLAAGASGEGTVAPVGFASLGSADYLYTYREVAVVPEPGTWGLGLVGVVVLAVVRRLRC
jgi:hypothetical protein